VVWGTVVRLLPALMALPGVPAGAGVRCPAGTQPSQTEKRAAAGVVGHRQTAFANTRARKLPIRREAQKREPLSGSTLQPCGVGASKEIRERHAGRPHGCGWI